MPKFAVKNKSEFALGTAIPFRRKKLPLRQAGVLPERASEEGAAPAGWWLTTSAATPNGNGPAQQRR